MIIPKQIPKADAIVKEWLDPNERQMASFANNRKGHLDSLQLTERLFFEDPVVKQTIRDSVKSGSNVLELNIIIQIMDSPEGLEPKSYKEIAEMANSTPDAIRRTKCDAVKKLREDEIIELEEGDKSWLN